MSRPNRRGPHRRRKLRVCELVTDSGEGGHVEVAPNEVNVVLHHVSVKASKKRGRDIALFGHNVVDMNGAERDRGSALLEEASETEKTAASGSSVSLLSKMAIGATRVRDELVRDSWSMITGLLTDDRMKPSTGRRNDIGGVPTGWAWISLKDRETVLMMDEITVCCINVTKSVSFGLPKFDHRKNQGSWFRKRTSTCSRICTDRIVGSRKGGTCTSLVGRN